MVPPPCCYFGFLSPLYLAHGISDDSCGADDELCLIQRDTRVRRPRSIKVLPPNSTNLRTWFEPGLFWADHPLGPRTDGPRFYHHLIGLLMLLIISMLGVVAGDTGGLNVQIMLFIFGSPHMAVIYHHVLIVGLAIVGFRTYRFVRDPRGSV